MGKNKRQQRAQEQQLWSKAGKALEEGRTAVESPSRWNEVGNGRSLSVLAFPFLFQSFGPHLLQDRRSRQKESPGLG